MKLRWWRDKDFADCWDLKIEGRRVAFVMRSVDTGMMGWTHYAGPSDWKELPGKTCEEVKRIVKATILLEG